MDEQSMQNLRSQVMGIGAKLSAVIERNKETERQNRLLRARVLELESINNRHRRATALATATAPPSPPCPPSPPSPRSPPSPQSPLNVPVPIPLPIPLIACHDDHASSSAASSDSPSSNPITPTATNETHQKALLHTPLSSPGTLNAHGNTTNVSPRDITETADMEDIDINVIDLNSDTNNHNSNDDNLDESVSLIGQQNLSSPFLDKSNLNVEAPHVLHTPLSMTSSTSPALSDSDYASVSSLAPLYTGNTTTPAPNTNHCNNNYNNTSCEIDLGIRRPPHIAGGRHARLPLSVHSVRAIAGLADIPMLANETGNGDGNDTQNNDIDARAVHFLFDRRKFPSLAHAVRRGAGVQAKRMSVHRVFRRTPTPPSDNGRGLGFFLGDDVTGSIFSRF